MNNEGSQKIWKIKKREMFKSRYKLECVNNELIKNSKNIAYIDISHVVDVYVPKFLPHDIQGDSSKSWQNKWNFEINFY